jgi:hypothetical protein
MHEPGTRPIHASNKLKRPLTGGCADRFSRPPLRAAARQQAGAEYVLLGESQSFFINHDGLDGRRCCRRCCLLRAGDVAGCLAREAGMKVIGTVHVLIVPADISRDVEIGRRERPAERLEARWAPARAERVVDRNDIKFSGQRRGRISVPKRDSGIVTRRFGQISAADAS